MAIRSRPPRQPPGALNGFNALDVLYALDVRAICGRDALDALNSLNALDAIDAIDAIDALNARDRAS